MILNHFELTNAALISCLDVLAVDYRQAKWAKIDLANARKTGQSAHDVLTFDLQERPPQPSLQALSGAEATATMSTVLASGSVHGPTAALPVQSLSVLS
ncbi:hypothetical protein FRB94_013024, partial [Tulasnella sp. JGI-2019a]